LDFDYSACHGRESWLQRDWEILDKLIWGTMIVDIGTITDANISEWLFRMTLGDRILSGRGYFVMRYQFDEDIPLTAAHLRKFVGLKTNVTTTTRAKWMKKVISQATSLIESRVSSELQKESMAAV
jgi:hypothetical protein